MRTRGLVVAGSLCFSGLQIPGRPTSEGVFQRAFFILPTL